MSKRRNFSVEFKRGVDAQRVDPFAVHERVKNYDASATWRPRWELVEKG